MKLKTNVYTSKFNISIQYQFNLISIQYHFTTFNSYSCINLLIFIAPTYVGEYEFHLLFLNFGTEYNSSCENNYTPNYV